MMGFDYSLDDLLARVSAIAGRSDIGYRVVMAGKGSGDLLQVTVAGAPLGPDFFYWNNDITGPGGCTLDPAPCVGDAQALDVVARAIAAEIPQAGEAPGYHASVAAVLRNFRYDHPQDARLAAVSRRFTVVAVWVADHLKGPEATICLRKLLEAKDAAVRAAREGSAQDEAAEVARSVRD